MTTSRHNAPPRGKWLAFRITLIGVILAAVAALSMAGAGPAYRTELLSLGDAFSMLRYGAYIAIGAAAVGLVALIIAALYRRLRPALLSALVIIASLTMVAVPWMHLQRAQSVPPIHDITTDTNDPPAFETLAAAREAAPNAVAYPGEATARQQRESYPDIQSWEIDAPLPHVLEAAEAEAREAGWEIASVTDDTIEATATTTWFGFKDDVVIRLSETSDGVRVDMRSASRLGGSDVGTNAARIRAYLAALAQRVEST
ncbi:DUF1499 domain-containing protein [Halomonas sp. TRM85114]|uniref:DUF1499 domain-containing protein n=1 Tax=Halomonas jincaotanensis TaxID=2810616 RepID=UPI001BD270AE|nr:DUF1499 domain-containing protein [Halomonas jincaotanensis]MBS9403593.1 DUF1499 domain-containing protein [Halomonas jincaotanensis]